MIRSESAFTFVEPLQGLPTAVLSGMINAQFVARLRMPPASRVTAEYKGTENLFLRRSYMVLDQQRYPASARALERT